LLVVTFLFVGSSRHGVRLDADGDHGGSYAIDQRGEARKRNRFGGLDCPAWLYGCMSKL
jgi:hypothetical protein